MGKTLPHGLVGPDGTLPRAGAEGHIKVQLSGFYKCTGYDMRSWRLSPLRGSYEATCEATECKKHPCSLRSARSTRAIYGAPEGIRAVYGAPEGIRAMLIGGVDWFDLLQRRRLLNTVYLRGG